MRISLYNILEWKNSHIHRIDMLSPTDGQTQILRLVLQPPPSTHGIQNDSIVPITRHEPFPLSQSPKRIGYDHRDPFIYPPYQPIPIFIERSQRHDFVITVRKRLVDQFDSDNSIAIRRGGKFLREDGDRRERPSD
jgi:hypothetical protein